MGRTGPSSSVSLNPLDVPVIRKKGNHADLFLSFLLHQYLLSFYLLIAELIYLFVTWSPYPSFPLATLAPPAADDAGSLSSALGLVLEGQAVFGGPRLKRGAVVIDSGKVISVAVEPSPAQGESPMFLAFYTSMLK